MCGVFSILDHNLNLSLKQKIDSLNSFYYRGPDNTDYMEIDNVFIGHHRLSIRDLSENSNQPKFSHNKRFVISYNGELYNNHQLLKNLKNKNIEIINKNSDTEILVNYISCFGIHKCLEDIQGMFAFICYDISTKRFFVCRDSFGEKPLYLYAKNKNFIFSSDILSIKKLLPNISINTRSLEYFLSLSYIPSPFSIYDDIYKLIPGECLIINGDEEKFDDIKKFKFFDPLKFVKKKEKITKDQIKNELIKSVESQLVSDVSIGTFLSGGIDSSLITSIASTINPNITTYTIGFEEQEYDESHHAKEISLALGLKNYNFVLKPKDLLNAVSKISKVYTEPFADSSQIPTFLLSKLSSANIKVALTGDGGDELFGGYNRYIYYKLFKKVILSPEYLKKFIKLVLPIFPINSQLKEKINNKILGIDDIYSFYYSMVDETKSQNSNLSKLFIELKKKKFNDITLLQLMDILYYLPDDILVKTDRASMYNSLETRAPFLNRSLYGLSMSLDDNKNINYFGGGKIILKEILSEYVDPKKFKRPKQGFGVPISKWLKDELKDWAGSFIKSDKLNNIIDMKFYDNLFEEHVLNKKNNSRILWNYLMFFDWYEKNIH